MADRLDDREARIADLEEQLARRSQIEQKIEALPDKVRETDEPDPPWPVSWYRRLRRDTDE